MEKVFVVVAFYSDRSGAKIIGAYASEADALDRKAAIDAAVGSMTCRAFDIRVGAVCDQDIYG